MIASSYHFVALIGIVLLFISPDSIRSAPSPTPPPPGTIDEKLFSGMRWRQVGPFRGGRALAIEGVVGEPDTYYFGAVAGGVWKTTDGGANWTPLFDKAPISSIGALAVAPSDHNVVYVGTGEAAIRGNTAYGTGVFKSIDGGKTWEKRWVESATEPTKPQLEVFQMLNSQLEEQLKKWAQVKQEDVAKVSELVKQANLPALIVSEKK